MRHVNYLDYDPVVHHTRLIGTPSDSIGLKPMMVLEAWANAYGTGLEGSRQAFKHASVGKQKLPVLIDPYRQIYFFPTQSPKHPDCMWINAAQIQRVVGDGLKTKILFCDGNEVTLPMGPRSIRRQLQRIELMRQTITRQVLADGLLFTHHP